MVQANANAGLVPISRDLLRHFYAQYPMEPVHAAEVEAIRFHPAMRSRNGSLGNAGD